MIVRAVGLAAGLAMVAVAGCREGDGGARGRADADASAPAARARPETAVLAGVQIKVVEPEQPRPISGESLTARMRALLTSSGAFVADEAAVPAGRVAVPAEVDVTVRYDVVSVPAPADSPGEAGTPGKTTKPGKATKPGKQLRRAAMVAVEAEVDWKASGDRPQPRENVLVERPLERGDEAALDQLVARLVADAMEVAGRGLAEQETLRQGDDGAVLAALGSSDPDVTLWALDLSAARRLAAAFDRAVALLEAPDPGVRGAALRFLVALRDPRAVEPLARRADFADPDTMRQLVEAVTAIGGPEAIEFLEMVAGGHDDRDMRERAREGLERLGRRQRTTP
jgi:hypothetical protein